MYRRCKLYLVEHLTRLGVDSDHGDEFINDELFRYCQDQHITFTRGREGHKNDNAHMEQKNGSVVRREACVLTLRRRLHSRADHGG